MSTTNYIKLGDSVVLPGTHINLLSFLNITLPNPAGLVGLYLIAGSVNTSLRNFADSTKPLSAIGSPTVSSFGAVLSASNYFDTGITTGADHTWTVVAKPVLASVSTQRACLVSNRRFTASTYRGDALSWEETNLLMNRFDKTAAASGQAPSMSVVGAVTTAWNGFASIVGADGVAQTGWRKNGATVWSGLSSATTRTVYTGDTLRIGGSPLNDAGSASIGLVALQNAILTQAQVDANMTYLSNLLSTNYGVAAF